MFSSFKQQGLHPLDLLFGCMAGWYTLIFQGTLSRACKTVSFPHENLLHRFADRAWTSTQKRWLSKTARCTGNLMNCIYMN